MKQLARNRIGDHRDELAKLLSRRLALHLRNDQGRYALAGLDDAFNRCLLADIGNEIQGMLRLEPHEVAARHHSQDLIAGNHRQMVDVLFHHEHRRLVGVRIGIHDFGAGAHDLRDPAIHRQAPGDDACTDVAVRHDADQMVTLVDQHGGHALVDHLLRHLADARRRR